VVVLPTSVSVALGTVMVPVVLSVKVPLPLIRLTAVLPVSVLLVKTSVVALPTRVSVALGNVTVPVVFRVVVPLPLIKLTAVLPVSVLFVRTSVVAFPTKVSVAFGTVMVPVVFKVRVPDPLIRLTAVFPVKVLLVRVSLPALVARVPAVGRVTAVVPVTVTVEAKLPEMVRVLASLLATPVPPLEGASVDERVVAVEALPVRAAVIVPAVKLPEASLATIALAVFALAAVVAEFETFPAVLIVFKLVSAMLERVLEAPEIVLFVRVWVSIVVTSGLTTPSKRASSVVEMVVEAVKFPVLSKIAARLAVPVIVC